MRRTWKETLTGWGMLAPYLVMYVIFLLYPIAKGGFISLHNASIVEVEEYVGLDNYRAMLTDDYFWEALYNTVYFVVISTPAMVAIGLGLALLVNAKLKGTVVFRTIFFMPYVLSVSVVSSIWLFIFRPYIGLLSAVSKVFGFTGEILWLDEPSLAWLAILITAVWWTVGFNMVIFLAGLQDIPEDYYEAARMDGASRWQQFLFVTLPSLKHVVILIVILQTIASFKLFAQPWLMTQGGPGTSTRALVQYIYQSGFIFNNMGGASAMAYALLGVTILIAFIQFTFLSGRRRKGGAKR